MNISQRTLNEAYKIVQNDLLTNFQKMTQNQVLRLPNIGVFEKQWKQKRCGLTNQNCQYYQITFRMSQVLKRTLDK